MVGQAFLGVPRQEFGLHRGNARVTGGVQRAGVGIHQHDRHAPRDAA